MDLGDWLRGLGRERYEAAFRENEINEKVLPSLTAEDLKDLGVDCSMPLRPCALMQVRKHHRPQRHPRHD
jgi:SAM domain (Sterile alpha motif)